MPRKRASKSAAIRAIMVKQPEARVKEIEAELNRRGIVASTALINKVKYGRSKLAKSRTRRQTKADAIRSTVQKLGRNARPRDIVADLARRGVAVSSAQVSLLRRSNHESQRSAVVSLDQLLDAKRFAERLGGIGAAREVLDKLAKIMA